MAIGARFRLLSCALKIVQGETTGVGGPGGGCRISKHILRQRIYSVAFDFFSLGPQTPLYTGSELQNDIRSLVGFWQVLYADSRYIRKESFATNGTLHTILYNMQ